MVVRKNDVGAVDLRIRGKDIDRATCHKYLGSWLNQTADSDEEIRPRIEIAKSAFMRMRNVLCCVVNLQNCPYVLRFSGATFGQLFYGCETWTLKVSMMNRLDALGSGAIVESFEFHGSTWSPTTKFYEDCIRREKFCKS